MRLAVVSPHFPVLPDPTYGRPIYLSLLGLQQVAPVEMEVFCPLSTYPAAFKRLFSPAQVRAMKEYAPSGIRTHYFGYPALPGVSRPANGIVSGLYLLPRLRRFRPDLVLAYWLYPEGYGAVWASQRIGVPVVTGSRGSDLRCVLDGVSRWFVRKTLHASSAVLTVSSELRDRAIDFGVDPSRVTTILNGCDSTIFHYRDRGEARARLGVPESAKAILFVGRISAPKGLSDLVKALAAAIRREPRLRLYCIGAGNFEYGTFEKELRSEIAALDLSSRVEFLGAQPAAVVASWLAACDALCLPSHTEGCPNVVIEALSCGTPVVGTTVGGIPELVSNDEKGILAPPHQPEALSAALVEVSARDWDRQAIARAFERGWDVVGRETYNVCKRVLESTAIQD